MASCSSPKSELPKAKKSERHGYAGSDGDKERQDGRRHSDPQSQAKEHTGGVGGIVDNQTRRGDEAIPEKSPDNGRA